MVGVLEQVLSRVQGYLPGSETRVIFRNRASMRRRTGRIDIYGVSPHHLGTTRDSNGHYSNIVPFCAEYKALRGGEQRGSNWNLRYIDGQWPPPPGRRFVIGQWIRFYEYQAATSNLIPNIYCRAAILLPPHGRKSGVRWAPSLVLYYRGPKAP